MSVRMEIDGLEHGVWTAEVGLDINNPIADQYHIVQTSDGLSLVVANTVGHGGWLAKNVQKLPVKARKISFRYTMQIDDATLVCAQVAETDYKVTDPDGWTYDLSAQWEMVKAAPGWMFQIDNASWTWTDTGIVIPAFRPYEEYEVIIEGALDYLGKRSAITAVHVDGEKFAVPMDKQWIPAQKVGWSPNDGIVTQLQQCTRKAPGGYTLRFPFVGYTLEDWQ